MRSGRRMERWQAACIQENRAAFLLFLHEFRVQDQDDADEQDDDDVDEDHDDDEDDDEDMDEELRETLEMYR